MTRLQKCRQSNPNQKLENQPKMNQSIIKTATAGAAAMSLIAGAAFAGVAAPSKAVVAPVSESFYNAGEVSLSAAALLAARTGTLGPNSNFSNSTAWGADLEAGYFITRNFGIALEGQYVSLSRPIWGTAVNDYLRAPLNESSRWAPYLLAGLGGIFGNGDGRFEGHVGAGIEYRITPKIGTFVDGRHVFVDGEHDVLPQFGLFRAGLKFVF